MSRIQSKKEILFITCYYPPSVEMASIRMEKLAKYLSRFGWSISIVTQKSGKTPGSSKRDGQTKVDYVVDPLRIVRISTSHSSYSNITQCSIFKKAIKMLKNFLSLMAEWTDNLIFIPDSYLWWSLTAYRIARRRITEKNIKIIWTSCPPMSVLIPGYMLKRSFKHLNWVIEIRDLLSFNQLYQWGWLKSKINSKLERISISSSDALIFLTESIEKIYRSKYQFFKPSCIAYNGYDPEDFKTNDDMVSIRLRWFRWFRWFRYGLRPTQPGAASHSTQATSLLNPSLNPRASSNKINFLYAGTFYGSRNPICFLKALRHVFSKLPDVRDRVRIWIIGKFIGSPHEMHETLELMASPELKDTVFMLGTMPHQEVLRYYGMADILLLITHQKGSEYAIPGKLFEYIGSGKRIFAMTDDPLPKEIIKRNKLGWCVSTTDVKEAAKVLQSVLQNPLSTYRNKKSAIEKFSILNQVEKIVDMLLNIEKGSTTGKADTRI